VATVISRVGRSDRRSWCVHHNHMMFGCTVNAFPAAKSNLGLAR
jgi:hypothetical protein